jgi:hypothetical protein
VTATFYECIATCRLGYFGAPSVSCDPRTGLWSSVQGACRDRPDSGCSGTPVSSSGTPFPDPSGATQGCSVVLAVLTHSLSAGRECAGCQCCVLVYTLCLRFQAADVICLCSCYTYTACAAMHHTCALRCTALQCITPLRCALLLLCCFGVSCRKRGLGHQLLLHFQRQLHLPGTLQARFRARGLHSLFDLHQAARCFIGLLVSCSGQVPVNTGVLHQHPALQCST